MGCRHEWIVGPLAGGPPSARSRPEASLSIDAHRNLRGPYTAAGTLIRRLLPEAYRLSPDLVREHELTLVSVAPETAAMVAVSAAVTRSFEFPREGNPPGMTLRLAHGVADFLLGYVERAHAFPFEIAFEHVHQADSLDCEFLGVLLRRADPHRVHLRIATDFADVREPLKSALVTYATMTRHRTAKRRSAETPSDADRIALARQYIDSDCTADDPALVQACADCPPDERRQLHLDRAAALIERHEPSLSLGGIPLHYERAGTGLDTFVSASLHCLRMAFYEAALDLARRGRRLADPVADREAYGYLTRHVLFPLLLLGRLDEVEALCRDCAAISDDPFLLAHCSYAMAMLHLRFYPPARRDLTAARVWVEQALEFTRRRPPSGNRLVNLAFLRNTMALVEMREGRPTDAVGMLDDSIAFLRREAPDSFDLECPILYRNRAMLHKRLGRTETAIADLQTMLEHEFSDAWAHLELAIILRACGRSAEALDHSTAAIRWSPPWTNAHHHRALVYTDLGRTDQALDDFARVLELDPTHLDALSDRAMLLYQIGRFEAARADVERGLAIAPMLARLLCLRGCLERRDGRVEDACRSFAAALEQQPALPDRVAAAVRRWLATQSAFSAASSGRRT